MIIQTLEHQPEPPADIVTRLRQIHPALGLKFIKQGGGAEPYWALIWTWPDNDPRRARILRGEIDPAYAFDLLSMLPMNCSVDEAYGYAVNSFKRTDNNTVKNLLDRVHAYNDANTAAIWAGSTDEAMNHIEVMGHKLFANEGKSVPKSYGGLPAPAKRRKSRR